MKIKKDKYTLTTDKQDKVNNCEHRLAYHAMAPYSWINDPNGFTKYNNEFHLFFQFHPFSPQWGPMHWGHYTSKDLVTWEHQPIALYPDKDYDKDGCFSGTAIEKDGELYLFYTGNVVDQNNNIVQMQCVAKSDDGTYFSKHELNPIIPTPPDGSNTSDFRDPCVFKKDDYYYMVVGSCDESKSSGHIILYRSNDLLSWDYINTIKDDEDKFGYMWECPALFELSGKDVLIFSPQGLESDGEHYNNLYQSGYIPGNLDYDNGTFSYGEFYELDRGFDFYAPQTTVSSDGRRIMIGWMDMWESHMPTQKNHWAGAMTLPRELIIEGDKIKCLPIKEIETYRKNEVTYDDVIIKEKTKLDNLVGTAYEMIVELDVDDMISDTFSIALRVSEDEREKTLLMYSKPENKITLDRNNSGIGPKGIRQVTLAHDIKQIKLRMFVDRSSLEVFINDGEYVMSARIYPEISSNHIYFDGDVKVNTILKWDLV